jgi:Uma2 family endonuclease
VVLGPSDVYEPDVVYISRERSVMINARGVMQGPPDLCIEVASDSTRRVDRTVKFERYAYFRVPEYWIVDTQTQAVAVFVLEADTYTLLGTAHGDDRIPSRVLPHLELRASLLFKPRW